jgi:RNA-directed DNA polymerase
MLGELDKELARRGHRFVRYADDSLIFCKSKRACLRVKESINRFIESILYLRVNKEKTTVGYIRGMKFFGYSFYKKSKGKWELCVHPKSYGKLKDRLKKITNRSNGIGYQKTKELLQYYLQGFGYPILN